MFQTVRGDLSPWVQQGQMSLQALSQGLGLGGGGDQKLTPEIVQQIYQRYMGRPVGQDEMQSLLSSHTSASDLERMVASSPEHLEHVNVQKNVSPVTMPLFGAGGQQGGPVAPGSLAKPFTLQDFQESPAYQFNLQQGMKAIENAASKNKTLYAPATLQDVGRFSQGLASNEFQNAMNNYYGFQDRLFNRLYSMSGSGQNAAVQTGAFGTNTAGQIGDAITGGAAARAAGNVGAANAISGGVGQGINSYMLNQILMQNQQPSVSLRSLPNMTGASDIGMYTA